MESQLSATTGAVARQAALTEISRLTLSKLPFKTEQTKLPHWPLQLGPWQKH